MKNYVVIVKNIKMNNRTLVLEPEAYLLYEMQKIKELYNKLGIYPYELYTLMYGIAIKEKISYGIDRHSKLMNRI